MDNTTMQLGMIGLGRMGANLEQYLEAIGQTSDDIELCVRAFEHLLNQLAVDPL